MELFRVFALMFGTTAAVYGFRRVNRALVAIALIFVAPIFDDFSQLELSELTTSTHKTFKALLDLLGWKISKSDKRLGFCSGFVSLGLLFDYAKLPKG